jgi:hypothetical protein
MRPYRDSSFFASIVSSSNFIELQAFNEFDQACQTLSFFPLIERAPLRPLNLRGIEVGAVTLTQKGELLFFHDHTRSFLTTL